MRRFADVAVALLLPAAAAAKRPMLGNGKIAFWSDVGSPGIYVVRPDGSGRTRLTPGTIRAKGASWSPDGKRIAFYGTTARESRNFDIFVMNADGRGFIQRLTRSTARDVAPAWSPSGDRIAYMRGNDIWVMNASGRNQRRLIADGGEPAWSFDGLQLAFTAVDKGNFDIYLASADGRGIRRLTTHRADESAPAFGPDAVTFTSYRTGDPEIYSINLTTGRLFRLTRNPARDDGASWSPDGTKLIFTSYRDGNGEVYVMNGDGSQQRRLTRTTADEDADTWQPLPR
jgi:Tol biopolymer transport system component